MSSNVASIWLKLINKGGRRTLICGIYREFSLLRQILPNNTDDEKQQLDRWSTFINQWCSADKIGECYIVGDTNLDQFKWANPENINIQMVSLVKNHIEVLGYQQLITQATRFWPQMQDSLIDHFWTSCPDKILYHKNLNNGTADHNSIEVAIKLKGQIGAPIEVKKRSLKIFYLNRYKSKISNIDWTNLYSTEDISLATNIFDTNILKILDQEAPMKTIQLKNNHKSWVKLKTRNLMKTRDDARNVARLSQNPADWQVYKNLRNLCTTSLKKDKKLHYKSKFLEFKNENDSGKLFKMTKKLLGWSKSSAPVYFLDNGQAIRSPQKMANLLLDTFSKKVEFLLRSLPPVSEDPHSILKSALRKWGKSNEREKFSLREISLIETANLLQRLGNSKSYGHEGLDAMSLKVAATSLLIPISYIVNLSIRKKKFANQWKIGKLVPIFKGKGLAKTDPSNYRPISILPVLSKLVERAVQDQMLDFMTTSKQLNRNHNAYLRGHSTTTTLLQLTDDIYTANDENVITVLATIDESCAFDCVNHQLLLQKMHLYNFTDATIEWFSDYLKGRSNYVTHNAKNSKMTSVIRGVPQGSVLGPVLYTIFTNELPDCIKDDNNCQNPSHYKDDFLYGPNCSNCGSIPCYADDATVVVTSSTRTENQDKILKSIDKVTKFLTTIMVSLLTTGKLQLMR